MQNYSPIYCVLLFLLSCTSLSSNDYNLIPYPQNLIPHTGSFEFNKRTVIQCSLNQPEALKFAQQFSKQFELVTGLRLIVKIENSNIISNSIVFQQTELSDKNTEGYELNVSRKILYLNAQTGNGFFYGLQTLYQLLPPEIYGKKKSSIKKWSVPCVLIRDAPRFKYRGLHLDVGRHFYPISFIKKYIAAMAIHKYNTFHWHLTEDQGWRIESKKYPRLTQAGSKRAETIVGNRPKDIPQMYDGKPHGGFYTQEEAREIVAYAKERYIAVIPEIELPGHAQAAIASYPFLSCSHDSTIKVATRWGIFEEVYCPRESTFVFLENILTEIMDIFPSNYIHIGGDECLKNRWKTCTNCQNLIKTLNLKDEHGLQSYFISRIEKFINSKGRQIIGWDEILEGGLAPNSTVMSWRGTAGGINAVKAGHDVIMTPESHCYFDFYQADPVVEPKAIGGYLTLDKVYQFEPVPSQLTSEEGKHILGAQANVWTEYMPTSKSVEYMVFPRMAAMAEALWSSKENRNWESFCSRMPAEFKRFDQMKINASKAFFDVQYQYKLTTDSLLQITLVCDQPDVQIRYNTKGEIPTLKHLLSNEPLILTKTTTITARAFLKGKPIGKTHSKTFSIIPLK